MITKKRHTVFTFIYAQIGIIALFACLTAYTVVRLLDVKEDVAIITQDAMPQMAKSASINNKIQMLATQSSLLANAMNEPSRRLVMQQVDSLMQNIHASNDSNVDTADKQRIAQQLAVIEQEIKSLNNLVKTKVALQQGSLSNTKRFTESILLFYANTTANIANKEVSDNLVEAISLILQLEAESRLSEVRQLEEQLRMVSQNASLRYQKANSSNAQAFEIKELLQFDELVKAKVELLLVNGRVRGRDNFLRNLMADLSSNLEYQTELINQNVLRLSDKTSKQIAKQAELTIALGILTILITILILMYLYKRFVVRIMTLSEQVDEAMNTDQDTISIEGSDEISHLADVFSEYLKKVKKQEKVLLNLSMTDPLTDIPNRRAFSLRLIEAVNHARRSRSPLTIVIADVDFFKAYNDRYGHTEGDNCLKMVASELQATMIRNTDFCARFGGEEFICILPDTHEHGAKLKAQQIHLAIESLKIPHLSSTSSQYVTLSLGVATISFSQNDQRSAEVIIEAADKALYEAKNSGRNKSCFSVMGSAVMGSV